MKKVVKKVPAKINLTLDVLGIKGNYHQIESMVASIDLFDAITVCERKDNRINVYVKGLPLDCLPTDNNAYKAAKLICEKYSINGVDIKIDKAIPIGGGLGGSSADIAGTLLAIKELYNVDCDLHSLANELGSDSAYMLKCGYAVISGRGENVERFNCDKTLYLLLITSSEIITARNCYKEFDKIQKENKACTKKAKEALTGQKTEEFYSLIKNDLQLPAITLVDEIDFNIKALKKAGAEVAQVTGSGPTAYGIFNTEEERNEAYRKLKPLFGNLLIKTKTINVEN